MAAIKKGGQHGLWKAVIQLVGSDGISYGQAGDTITAGTISQGYVAQFPKTAGISAPDRTTIDFTGGDRWVTSYTYGINSLGSFDFSVQDEDADLIAMLTGTAIDSTTNTEWNIYTEDLLATQFPDVSLMLIWRVQSFEDSTFGQTFYVHQIVPRCSIVPKGGEHAYQSPADQTYQVTPKTNKRLINGTTVPTTLLATDNTLVYYKVVSANPLYMFVMKANAASATAVSAYKPVTSTVGTASATKNLVVKVVTGTATPGVADTVTVATGTFAIGTALPVASGNMLHILHETNYEAV